MKVALVHDWLTGMRGGERCLEEFLNLYPDADIFTLIHIPGVTSDQIDARVKQVSFLNKIPKIALIYRWLLPLFPFAVRDLKIEGYDLVISLNHAVAKNVKVPATACHICYCFTPMRYAWDQMLTYFGLLSYLFAPILLALRVWDRYCSREVTQFVSISKFVAARIRCFYKRTSQVIYPPIKDFWLEPKLQEAERSNFPFLYAGALVRYKNVAQIVQAFNFSGLPLVIAGSGPESEKLKSIAKSNIQFLGKVTDRKLVELYQNSRALIFAAKEDFGLIPVESLASGLPVIGPFAGALKESLNNLKYWDAPEPLSGNETGVFFRYDYKNLAAEINRGKDYFIRQEKSFSAVACREQARKFDLNHFRKSWFGLIQKLIESRQLVIKS